MYVPVSARLFPWFRNKWLVCNDLHCTKRLQNKLSCEINTLRLMWQLERSVPVLFQWETCHFGWRGLATRKSPGGKKKGGGGLYSVTETKITAGKNSFNKHIAGRNTAWNRTGDIQEMWLGSALLYAGDVSHCGGVWSPPVQTPGEIPQCRIRLVRPMPGLILICQRN